MTLLARDAMQSPVHTVTSTMSLAELERTFLRLRVTGLPVVDAGRLTGIVSRSDVVRQVSAAHTRAEELSDYYHDLGGFGESEPISVEEVAEQAGEQLERLKVRDFMVRAVVTAPSDCPMREIAKLLVHRRIHRVVIVEDGQPVGIISTIDIVRLVAEGRSASIE